MSEMTSTEAVPGDGHWFQSLVEKAVAGILVEQDGVIVYANQHTARMVGRNRAELVGAATASFLGQAQGKRHLSATAALLAGTDSASYSEYQVALPAGGAVSLAVFGSRIALNGRPATLGVLHDITAQHTAEAALRASEEKYRQMVGGLTEGVLIFDAQGHVQGANPAAERLLGRTLDQMLSTHLADWQTRGSDGQPLSTAELPLARTLATGESRHDELIGDLSPTGALRWINVNARALRESPTGAITGAVVSFSDVTERRRVEEDLLRSEQTNRTLMESLSDGVFVAQDYRFVFANPALPKMLGYRHEEFVGLPFVRVIAPQDIGVWMDRFRRRVGSGEEPVRSYEVRFLRKNGALVELELVANRTRYLGEPAVLGLVRNITDRKQVEAELERHRNHLEELVHERTCELQQAVAARLETETFAQTIAENIPGRVAYWDHEFRCRFANQVYCDWFGKPGEEIIGRTIEQVFGAGPRPDSRVRRALAGQAQQFERREVSAAGETGTWLVHYIPDWHGDEVRGFFVMATNITPSKLAQARLEVLNAELMLARDKAEAGTRAKSSFLANMSHEIRTPMNAIIGITHLLLRDTREPQGRDRLNKVAEAAQHLLNIINNVLDLSKIEAGKLDLETLDFELDGLLSRSCSLVSEEAQRKGLALVIDRGDVPAGLRGDAVRLSQALVNLLSNAVKFTERGTVTLRASVAGQDKGGLLVRFEVRDTGVGIPREQLAHIYTAFEQADGSTTRRFGGTGLGLAINHHLAALMGGTVGVESEPGAGSLFWFSARLQRALSAALPPLRVPLGQPADALLRQRHGGARVLLADDNQVNQEVARELLHSVGLQVDVADTGRRAVQMADKHRYDLILMDMQMPEMDGLQATRAIRTRARLAEVPIIAMTANAFSEDRAACLAAGMNDHVGKPVEPDALYDTLLRWLTVRPERVAGIDTGPRALDEQAVPSPVPAPAHRLPELPGLDTARGLKFCAGHTESYVQALKLFADLYADGLPGVGEHLIAASQGSTEALAHEVHTLGGAAAVVGAVGLETLARRLDSMLRRDAQHADVQPGLAALQRALEALVGGLRELC